MSGRGVTYGPAATVDAGYYIAMIKHSLVFLSLAISVPAWCQAAGKSDEVIPAIDMPAGMPGQDAYVVKAEIENEGKPYIDGPLRIAYSDGTLVTINAGAQGQKLEATQFGQQVGFHSATIAKDQQTVGWEGDINPGWGSYSIPNFLYVYRRGRIVFQTNAGSMIYDYLFSSDSKRVAILWGYPHGGNPSFFELYDLKSGKKIQGITSFPDRNSDFPLDARAPKWAKELAQDYLHQETK
jgi:hypothetical protein